MVEVKTERLMPFVNKVGAYIPKVKSLIRHGRLSWLYTLFKIFILVGVGYLMAFPVFKLLTQSISSWQDYSEGNIVFIPRNPTFLNFSSALKYFNYKSAAFMTAQFTLISTFVQLISTSITGYGLARFKFKGNNLIFIFVILTIIVPIQTAQIPLFLYYQNFDFFSICFKIKKIPVSVRKKRHIESAFVF